MSVWPYLPVWPLLLALSALVGLKNVPASICFMAAIISVRLIIYFELNNSLYTYIFLYSIAAFVTLFFVDRVAGGFFAIVSMLLIGVLVGVLGRHTQVIVSEAVLILGMAVSAFVGPSGGILGDQYSAGCDHPDGLGPIDHSPRDPVVDQNS